MPISVLNAIIKSLFLTIGAPQVVLETFSFLYLILPDAYAEGSVSFILVSVFLYKTFLFS